MIYQLISSTILVLHVSFNVPRAHLKEGTSSDPNSIPRTQICAAVSVQLLASRARLGPELSKQTITRHAVGAACPFSSTINKVKMGLVEHHKLYMLLNNLCYKTGQGPHSFVLVDFMHSMHLASPKEYKTVGCPSIQSHPPINK